MSGSKVFSIIEKEAQRQRSTIELIASENFVSDAILKATGSILTNKYAEGYPGKRYYGGCEHVDEIEVLAIDYAKRLFQAEHANVQPHSGSSANMAVYMSVLKPNDVVLAMNLKAGGHLTHGHRLSFSGNLYQFVHYGVDKITQQIDYDEVARLAKKHQPKLIVAGASAYPRIIDFKRFKEIADSVDAYLMADIAHISGLIAAGHHPSPVPYADFVTTTTHKTLRGPRGGLVLSKAKHAKALDRSVFPGIQGGPLMHVIAAKAICFEEALSPDFKTYQAAVIANAQAMAQTFMEHKVPVISGGTDNHLLMIDVYKGFNLTGKEAQAILESVHITTNKNSIPFDELSPMVTSGIRLGSAAMTTLGYGVDEFKQVALWIIQALQNQDDLDSLRQTIEKFIQERN